jgi:hypothetical protein
MAAQKLKQEDLQRIEELAKGWGKIIVRQYWGEKGPGLDVDLNQMEDVALAAVHGLLAGTLEVATQQQAHQLGEEQACPACPIFRSPGYLGSNFGHWPVNRMVPRLVFGPRFARAWGS